MDEILFPSTPEPQVTTTDKTSVESAHVDNEDDELKFFDTARTIDKHKNDDADDGDQDNYIDCDKEHSPNEFSFDLKTDKLEGADNNDELPAKKLKTKKEMEEEEREKMQVLVSNFTEDQLDRYEMYRRAAFPKAAVKRLMQTITGCSVSQNVVIAMSGIAKVFVGEIVEEALDVMEAAGETGAMQPKYLREAVRRLRQRGRMPIGRFQNPYFRLN